MILLIFINIDGILLNLYFNKYEVSLFTRCFCIFDLLLALILQNRHFKISQSLIFLYYLVDRVYDNFMRLKNFTDIDVNLIIYTDYALVLSSNITLLSMQHYEMRIVGISIFAILSLVARKPLIFFMISVLIIIILCFLLIYFYEEYDRLQYYYFY